MVLCLLFLDSPFCCWAPWRCCVWPWTSSSSCSTPSGFAAGDAKAMTPRTPIHTRSSPAPTAAAPPGASSSPHSSAGESVSSDKADDALIQPVGDRVAPVSVTIATVPRSVELSWNVPALLLWKPASLPLSAGVFLLLRAQIFRSCDPPPDPLPLGSRHRDTLTSSPLLTFLTPLPFLFISTLLFITSPCSSSSRPRNVAMETEADLMRRWGMNNTVKGSYICVWVGLSAEEGFWLELIFYDWL